MPFQSEKQRRYLWANEPEIARDWTDTYGSGIAKALGGRIGYQDGTLTKEQIAMIKDMLAKGMDTSTIETITGATADQIKNLPLDDQSKGTIEFDPNNVEISKAGMIPSWEDLKTLGGNLKYDLQRAAEPGMDIFDTWEGAQGQQLYDKNYRDIEGARSFNVVPTPSEENLMMGDIDAGYGLIPQEGIMQAGTPFVDDYNYPQRQTMAANWSELDDAEAQNVDTQRRMELARLAGMEQYPTEDEDEDEDTGKGNWLRNIASFIPFLGKNTKTGLALRAFGNRFMPQGGIGNFANTMRGGLTQRGYEQARDARIKQSRIDYMLDRRAAGDPYSQKNLNVLTMGSRPGHYDVPTPAPSQPSGNGGGWDRPNVGRNEPGAGPGRSPTGGDVRGTPFDRGGLASLWRR